MSLQIHWSAVTAYHALARRATSVYPRAPRHDRVAVDLAVTADLNERAELVKGLNDMLVQDNAIVPLIRRGRLSAHADNLSGVRLNVWDSQMWNVADWTRVGQ